MCTATSCSAHREAVRASICASDSASSSQLRTREAHGGLPPALLPPARSGSRSGRTCVRWERAGSEKQSTLFCTVVVHVKKRHRTQVQWAERGHTSTPRKRRSRCQVTPTARGGNVAVAFAASAVRACVRSMHHERGEYIFRQKFIPPRMRLRAERRPRAVQPRARLAPLCSMRERGG